MNKTFSRVFTILGFGFFMSYLYFKILPQTVPEGVSELDLLAFVWFGMTTVALGLAFHYSKYLLGLVVGVLHLSASLIFAPAQFSWESLKFNAIYLMAVIVCLIKVIMGKRLKS